MNDFYRGMLIGILYTFIITVIPFLSTETYVEVKFDKISNINYVYYKDSLYKLVSIKSNKD